MWVYIIENDRTAGLTDRQEHFRLEEGGGEIVFFHLTTKRALAMVKADITDEQARILSDDSDLLKGSVRLAWFEPLMAADIRRTLDENDRGKDSARIMGDVKKLSEELFGGLFGKDMPLELVEKLREHHKHCGKVGCPVPKPPEVTIKVGDRVRWTDGNGIRRSVTVIKAFPAKTPFTELPPTAEKFTGDLLSGVNLTAEYSQHDRFIVEMVEGGETVYAAPRADMLFPDPVSTPGPDSPRQP